MYLDNLPKRIIICTGTFSIFVFISFGCIINEIKNLPFFHIGPSDNLTFFHININTWFKWVLVIGYVIYSTLFASLVTEFVMPYIMTQIQDVSKPNPAKPWQMQLLIQLYYMTWSIQTVITTYVYFSQLDIVITQIIVYNIVSFLTTRHYIKIKKKFDTDVSDYGSMLNIIV